MNSAKAPTTKQIWAIVEDLYLQVNQDMGAEFLKKNLTDDKFFVLLCRNDAAIWADVLPM